MPSPNFCKLIDEICKAARIPNAQSLYEKADFTIDQVKFTLVDGSSEGSDRVIFYCEFGLIPPKSIRANALQKLMERNLIMYGADTSSFSINAETNRVVLMGRLTTTGRSPENLMTDLAKHAAAAKAWQKSFYLGSQEDTVERSKQSADRQSYQSIIMKRSAA